VHRSTETEIERKRWKDSDGKTVTKDRQRNTERDRKRDREREFGSYGTWCRALLDLIDWISNLSVSVSAKVCPLVWVFFSEWFCVCPIRAQVWS
jgi:hypothetical protein